MLQMLQMPQMPRNHCWFIIVGSGCPHPEPLLSVGVFHQRKQEFFYLQTLDFRKSYFLHKL
jgi:hypothetical protein